MSRSSAPASRPCRSATIEAAESLGFSRLQTYRAIVLPLAFRISLPALNNNLVNLVKTTTSRLCDRGAGDALRVEPDLVGLVNVPEMMNVLLICYVRLVGMLV